jgi:hypothetical protein
MDKKKIPNSILNKIYDDVEIFRDHIIQKNLNSFIENFFDPEDDKYIPKTIKIKLNNDEDISVPLITLVNNPIIELKDINIKFTSKIESLENTKNDIEHNNVDINVTFSTSSSNIGIERIKDYLNF